MSIVSYDTTPWEFPKPLESWEIRPIHTDVTLVHLVLDLAHTKGRSNQYPNPPMCTYMLV